MDLPEAIDNGNIILDKNPEHVCRFEVIANLGQEKGDVASHVQAILLAAPFEVLAKEGKKEKRKRKKKERFKVNFLVSSSKREGSNLCKNFVGQTANGLETREKIQVVDVNTILVETRNVREFAGLFEGDLQNADQRVDDSEITKKVLLLFD